MKLVRFKIRLDDLSFLDAPLHTPTTVLLGNVHEIPLTLRPLGGFVPTANHIAYGLSSSSTRFVACYDRDMS